MFYLIVVILGRFVNQRLKKRKENEKKRIEKADKSTNGFQYSKAYETKTDSVHRPATRSYVGGVIETNNNHITDQNLDHSTLKSVLISEVIENRFGIDNPALGKQMISNCLLELRLEFAEDPCKSWTQLGSLFLVDTCTLRSNQADRTLSVDDWLFKVYLQLKKNHDAQDYLQSADYEQSIVVQLLIYRNLVTR